MLIAPTLADIKPFVFNSLQVLYTDISEITVYNYIYHVYIMIILLLCWFHQSMMMLIFRWSYNRHCLHVLGQQAKGVQLPDVW